MLSKKTAKWLTWAGIILPITLVIYFVYKYGITFPFWDQWEFVSVLEKLHYHNLIFADLWQQHNEHRIFFPKLLMFILASISGWNIFLELCTNIVLACLSLYFLFSLINNTIESDKKSILKIITSLLIFSMVQFENWSWGWQIQIFMSVLGAIIAIWSLSKWQGKTIGLIIAISGAIISSYSFGSGLVIWPAVLFILIFGENRKINHIIIWIIFCFVTVFLYFYHYKFSKTNAPISHVLSHLSVLVQFILAYLGSSLSQTVSFSRWISVILLIISVIAIFDIRRLNKEHFKKMIPWMALSIYVIMSAFVTGLGRVGLGVEQSMASRYTTISTLFVISAAVLLYNSIVLNLEKKKKASLKDIVFIVIVSAAFSTTYIDNYIHGLRNMKIMGDRVNGAAVHLKNPDNASDEDLKRLYPNPDTVRQRMKILNDMGIKFPKEK